MSDKALTEAEWKKFAKGRGLKDDGLLKALAALDKASNPEASLAALDNIAKQGDLLRKAAKGDKDVAGRLDEIDKALAKERKLHEAAAKKQQLAAEAAQNEDEDSPAQLSSKMIPLLREVRKGVVLQAMVALAGKSCAVMVSRRAIGPTQRKLLSTQLGTTSGVKFVPGECLFEANAHTFVVQSQAAGLAKRIRQALLEQTEQRFKVRVRGEDPNDIDDDGEPAEDSAAEATDTPTANPPVQAGPPPLELALQEWRQARGAAVTHLKALTKEVADARLPETSTAIIQMSAVLKNLSAEPRTAQQVQELLRYLNEDDIVLDVCDIDGDIRTPMLNALQAMQQALNA